MGLSPDDPRLGRVAYAKLQGDGLEYFIRKYEVVLGRKSKSTELDIVLGVFELTVMGKNGVTVNGILHTPSSAPQQLYTQDFLQVGEQKFFFLLPKGTSRRRPPSASPPASKPESTAVPAGGEQISAAGPATNAPVTISTDKSAQPAGPIGTTEASLNIVQPQQIGGLQGQIASYTVVPAQGQQQSSTFPSAYSRPVIETAHQPFAQT